MPAQSFGGFDKSLIEDDLVEPYEAWSKDPTPENSQTLLRAVEPSIRSAVKAHVGDDNPLVMGRAKIIALNAMKNYNPKGARISTYLSRQLQGIKRHNRNQLSGVRVPENVQLQRAKIQEEANQFEIEYGREPTYDELSRQLHMPIKKVQRIMSANTGLSESQIQDANGDVYQPGVNSQAEDSISVNLLYEDESEINKLIMEYTLGMYGQPVLKNQDIARKLGISPGAVSQRKKLIQERLLELERNGF